MYDLNTIKRNIESIREEIAAFDRDVTLLCATKTVPAEIVNAIHEYGITDIGENRVQEFKEKYPLVSVEFNWHIIGALQTNKVKYVVDKVKMIHSVDRRELADEIDSKCEKIGAKMNVLVEVNIGKEPNKSGTTVQDLGELLDYVKAKPCLNLCGLMTVMPIGADERPYAEMQALFEENKERYGLKYLSMGMSDDYRTALKYGSNILRIGRAVFGERVYNAGGK